MAKPRTELHQVLLRGADPKEDLARLLNDLGDTPVKGVEEARTICELLRSLPSQEKKQGVTSRLFALTALFQVVDTREAFDILRDEGIPELCRICDTLEDSEEDGTIDDLLFVLKVLAMYRAEEGTDRVIRAARKPLKPDAYMWSVILGQFNDKHPHTRRLLGELADPLPEGFLAVALLDCANGNAMAGADIRHPFDSPEGNKRLHAWLASRNEEEYSFARSATTSLPFISNPERDQLFALAMDHPDTEVQMEAVWASATLGSEAGLKVLARYCLDPNHSWTACRYLSELGREDAIPAEALDPDFQAKAEFANWLSHPNELGRPPDELEIVDRRELLWPPEGERKPFWLIKYRVKDTTGLGEEDVDCGLVGSVTFCLFSYDLAQRPPEDAYAIHCYWEMEGQGLIKEVDVEPDDDRYDGMLGQWHGGQLGEAQIVHVAKISPKLAYPRRVVVLATANLNAEPGWVVLDGERSMFYPKADFPDDVDQRTVLKMHVGRQLLGYQDQPDRRKYLARQRATRDPRQVVQAYEKLLVEANSGDEERRKQLLGRGSPLEKHFDAYVDAQAAVTGARRADVVIRTYEALLAAAQQGSKVVREAAMDNFSPLGKVFEKYADALATTGRGGQIDRVIELIAPHWDHNVGYGDLGTAAFRCERFELAEQYFTKLRQSYDDVHRSEEMSLLAEIWRRRGRSEDARALLIDCMKKVLAESKTATGSDKDLFEKWYQTHRTTYLRLFPDRGEAFLSKHGLPPSTRR